MLCRKAKRRSRRMKTLARTKMGDDKKFDRRKQKPQKDDGRASAAKPLLTSNDVAGRRTEELDMERGAEWNASVGEEILFAFKVKFVPCQGHCEREKAKDRSLLASLPLHLPRIAVVVKANT